jgi:hypothetical protein
MNPPMPIAAPDHLHDRLPEDAYYHLVRTLCLTLPPPLTDSPDALAQRNHAAITRITALVPANAAEADLAALYVAASEQWKDCLRLAQLPETTPQWAAKCRAQALSMMRQAESALRLLFKLQDVRARREADNTACDRAAWTEHCAIALMAEALSPRPMPAAGAQPPAPPPAPVEDAEPDPACRGPRSGVAEAEQYAAIYPERAALIRRLGRVPDNATFGPPDDDLVQALITARTPALAALDREFASACAA